ncbi:DUF2256 domain-containing protein [Pararhizobium antarcticum]|uniref:DUF2256 domain-containing protein n=1 Tax=Pararhizobium antarcticum TaxID=1798805 RepID=UPI0008FFB7C1|nr:DUF2256 domain-containing protein [Pararhizobium antarcticum]
MAKMIRKGDLPTKICTGCGLSFAWRRKWAKTWTDVKFCSERCRQSRNRRDVATGPA